MKAIKMNDDPPIYTGEFSALFLGQLGVLGIVALVLVGVLIGATT